MVVTKKAVLPDGTTIQIEDWSKDYPFYKANCTLAAYPKSKADIAGMFAPKFGERFRAEFEFETAKLCETAFSELQSGNKILADYAEYLVRKTHLPALLGR